MDRLETALEKQGMVQTLRRGFSIAGAGHLDLSEAAPEDQRNEKVLHRYASNRLRVVPQLKYHPGRELAIDLGLFLNGLPLATVELKTDFTQSVEHAKAQYRRDRLPVDPVTKSKYPLLTQHRGAVVHFAMSDSEIWMTTKLAGEDTFFLPFNKGDSGRAGNPAQTNGDYPVAYFWEEICRPDAFLRIFHSFVYVEKKNVVDLKGNWSVKETLIFPRFHQFDAVNKMIADAKEKGPGHPYLCEHSAGSGKTSTIAWTAHDLVKLRRDDGTPIFDTVIIVTDRNVLDGQLQDAVQQIDHQKGLIAAIDRETSSKSKSDQLSEATPLEDQVAFVNQVAAITRENPVVMAQINKNSKDQAMKGNLPGAVQAAVVRTMSSHSTLATLLLSKDRQALPILEGVIYEILKRGETLNLRD